MNLIGSFEWAKSHGEMLFLEYCKTLNIVRAISEGPAFEAFTLNYTRWEWENEPSPLVGYPDLAGDWKRCREDISEMVPFDP